MAWFVTAMHTSSRPPEPDPPKPDSLQHVPDATRRGGNSVRSLPADRSLRGRFSQKPGPQPDERSVKPVRLSGAAHRPTSRSMKTDHSLPMDCL
jgi:hypothetical protein